MLLLLLDQMTKLKVSWIRTAVGLQVMSVLVFADSMETRKGQLATDGEYVAFISLLVL